MIKKTENGYLSIYMALVLTVLLSLFLTLFEGVRSNTIRMEAECIMNIGLNSILGEYHRKLFEKYNILAIDSTYGTSFGGVANTQTHLREYLEKNMVQKAEEHKLLQTVAYKDFLKMKPSEIKMTKVSTLTDCNGEVFRREAVHAVKDDVGLVSVDSFWDWMQTVESNNLQGRDLSQEKQAINREMQKVRGKDKEWEEDKWGQFLLGNATDELDRQWAEDILGFLLEDTSQLSHQILADDNLIYERMQHKDIDSGNWQLDELSEDEKLLNKFFFQEYLMKYFGHFRGEEEMDVLQYQIEYLIGGKRSDVENLKEVVVQISSIRDAANMAYLLSDSEKYSQAEVLGTFVANIIFQPELKDLITLSLVTSWAFAESLYDMKQIMAGGRVPLIKDAKTWHYSLDDILWAGFESPTVLEQEGLSYEDYLRVLLALVSDDTVCWRAMNMLEANIRNTEGNQFFQIDKCFVAVEAYVKITSAYGYQYEITRQRTY